MWGSWPDSGEQSPWGGGLLFLGAEALLPCRPAWPGFPSCGVWLRSVCLCVSGGHPVPPSDPFLWSSTGSHKQLYKETQSRRGAGLAVCEGSHAVRGQPSCELSGWAVSLY